MKADRSGGVGALVTAGAALSSGAAKEPWIAHGAIQIERPGGPGRRSPAKAFVIALLRRAAPCPAPRLRSRLLHRRNRADIRRMIGLTAPGQERSCPRAAYRSLSRSDPILAQRELFSTSGAPAPCPHL